MKLVPYRFEGAIRIGVGVQVAHLDALLPTAERMRIGVEKVGTPSNPVVAAIQ